MLHQGGESEPLHYAFAGVFGVLDGPLGQLYGFLSRNKMFAKSWSDQLRVDLGVRENVGIIILAMALILNARGLVLFFTSNPKRLKQTVHRLTENSFSEKALLEFRQAATEGIHAN